MYKESFGLKRNPFAMTPDPSCLFLTEQHREAVAALIYAITERKGLLVLTGEVGTGKTTVLARVLGHLPRSSVQFSVVLHPTLTPEEFLEMVMLDFGIPDIPASKAQRLTKLQRFLLEGRMQNKISALIVDEAHKLSPAVLEEIRLLGNFDYADQKLLQIVLVGQSELDALLRREELRQLKQRVAVRVSLKPLSQAEVHDYIRYRWKQAGGGEAPFSLEAIEQVALVSRGIPRLVNSVCDQALLLAYAKSSRQVEQVHIHEAARDLDLALPQGARPAGLNGAAAAAPVVSARSTPAAVTPAGIIGEIRVPEFAGYGRRKASMWSRWAAKLGIA